MPLVLFTDSYATLIDIDLLMNWHVLWKVLPDDNREDRIKSASDAINRLVYKGRKIDPGQAMKFPRNFHAFDNTITGDDDIFSQENQENILTRAVRIFVEFNLNRRGIGATEHSLADEQVTPRQDSMPREVLVMLNPYRKW